MVCKGSSEDDIQICRCRNRKEQAPGQPLIPDEAKDATSAHPRTISRPFDPMPYPSSYCAHRKGPSEIIENDIRTARGSAQANRGQEPFHGWVKLTMDREYGLRATCFVDDILERCDFKLKCPGLNRSLRLSGTPGTNLDALVKLASPSVAGCRMDATYRLMFLLVTSDFYSAMPVEVSS